MRWQKTCTISCAIPHLLSLHILCSLWPPYRAVKQNPTETLTADSAASGASLLGRSTFVRCLGIDLEASLKPRQGLPLLNSVTCVLTIGRFTGREVTWR
jgi:hypothetical protein